MLTSGGLQVTKNVTISGPGANQFAVNGNQALFAFGVFPQRAVSISGLSIRNAQVGIDNNEGTVSVSNCVLSGNSSAGLYNDASQGSIGASMTVANSIISNNSGSGAANNQGTLTVNNCVLGGNSTGIFNFGPLTVSNCVVSGNSQGIANNGYLTVVNSNVSDNAHSGISFTVPQFVVLTATIRSTTVSGNLEGGIFASVDVFVGSGLQLTISDCTISGNSLFGGIHCEGAPNVAVTNSTISGNSANAGFPAGDTGGGIHCDNGLSVENSTVSGNSAATSGGGIYGVTNGIVNSTISGNSAGTSAGGIYTEGSLFVANSTITGNSASSGGGIYNEQFSSLEISNTILNAGALGENIFNNGGTVTSDGYNLSSDDGGGYLTGPGDQINTDPLLGPLQDNGGPTFTHALLPGSPAIDAGDPNFIPPPLNDQRGCPFDRVSNVRIDIGSFETQPPRRPCPTTRPRPTPPPRP
ncbi:MAG: right-handed parallel beta-helix repeat-containing protein [Candidatus Udaeobacter sp.]